MASDLKVCSYMSVRTIVGLRSAKVEACQLILTTTLIMVYFSMLTGQPSAVHMQGDRYLAITPCVIKGYL